MLLKIPCLMNNCSFPSSKNSHFQTEPRTNPFLSKWCFIYAQPRFETEAWSNSDKWTIQKGFVELVLRKLYKEDKLLTYCIPMSFHSQG